MNLPEGPGETKGHVPSAVARGVSKSADDMETPPRSLLNGRGSVDPVVRAAGCQWADCPA
jgi:hypothetical protein